MKWVIFLFQKVTHSDWVHPWLNLFLRHNNKHFCAHEPWQTNLSSSEKMFEDGKCKYLSKRQQSVSTWTYRINLTVSMCFRLEAVHTFYDLFSDIQLQPIKYFEIVYLLHQIWIASLTKLVLVFGNPWFANGVFPLVFLSFRPNYKMKYVCMCSI